MNSNEISGFLLIHKPVGISSYDCIRHIKRSLPKKTRIGHAGTLDVFAQGLMIIAIGRQSTKQLTELSNCSKEYIAKAKLGELTDTLDLTGKVIENLDASHIPLKDIQTVIDSFPQTYQQTPPAYSALKHQGQPLYHLARTNKITEQEMHSIVTAKTRMITIHSLELIDFNPPFFTVKAHVSKGTYIRSLMNDIALKLGVPATTYDLIRIQIGQFSLEKAVDLNEINSIEEIKKHLFCIKNEDNSIYS